MFDKKEYREMFSQVTASPDTYRRVMEMKTERKRAYAGRGLARAALVAALVALMALTVSASETVQNWFIGFFADQSQEELSQGQVAYIEENAEVILDSQTIDGWTVELRSAMHDGVYGYVLFHVEGPEDMVLPEWAEKDGNVRGQILFGNGGIPGKGENHGAPTFFEYQEELKYGGYGFRPLEDGDGLRNTADFMVTLNPDMKRSTIDPFGPDAVYRFCFEDIVWTWNDVDYQDELIETKYPGQEFYQFTEEETKRIHLWENLAEGTWEFEIVFSEMDCNTDSVELLTEPVKTLATLFGDDFEEPKQVTVHSVQLRSLSVTIACADGVPVMDFSLFEEDEPIYPCVVLKDGTQINMICSSSNGSGTVSMYLEQPIVFEDVDYIRMADGTIIPMPEMTE